MIQSKKVMTRARPVVKGKSLALKKMGFTKSRTSDNMILKLRKGFLLKCGNSLKKYADSYAVNLNFDEASLTMHLEYGKVSPKDNDFMPTGDNWEMWYGEDNIPTKYSDVDIVVEAYMFVKPYSIDNDRRKGTTSYMDNGYKEWVIESFRMNFPEFTGVSDEHLEELDDFNEYAEVLRENNSDIQSIRVTGKLKFYAYNNAEGTLTKIYTHALNSSSDFYNSVEDFITFFEANSHDAWWTALGKFDEYIIANGFATEEDPVGYNASARKSADIEARLSRIEDALGLSVRKSRPVMRRPVVKSRPVARKVARARPIAKAKPVQRKQPRSAW